MTIDNEINLIKRLCILNFLELQDIRRKLNIAPSTSEGYDYPNAVPRYLNELDNKMRNLVKDRPHLLDQSAQGDEAE